MAKLKKDSRIQEVRLGRNEKTTPIERIFERVVGRKMNRAERLTLCGRSSGKPAARRQ